MIFDKQFIFQLRKVFQLISTEIIPLYDGISAINVRQKSDRSPVTDADMISSQILIEFLSKTGYPVLSEEDLQLPKKGADYWVIDPLDGTADFIKHTGDFTCMIAYISGGKPVFGAVYIPLADCMYYACKNKGAFKYNPNIEEKLSVSYETDINKMTLVVSKNHLLPSDKIIAEKLKVKKMLQMGSLGLKAVCIAEKNADIYFNTSNKTSVWDTAASEVIITEAGGTVTDILGNKLRYDLVTLQNADGVVISNNSNHTEILTIIQNTLSHEKYS